MRDVALHFWPWYSKAPRMVLTAALWGSALEWMRW